MMNKIAPLAVLAPLAFAGFTTMESNLEAISGNNTQFRGVTNLMGALLPKINKYGCWCYFDSDHGKGKSQPVDDVDAICKMLHEGYECAILDAEEAGEECVPWEADYDAAAAGFETIVEECQVRNADKSACSINACIVEQWFIVSVFQSFIGGNQHREDYLHVNGFDTDSECPTRKGAASDHSCCGLYPFRHPFKTYGGARSCCGSKTYDNSILSCCGDEKVRLSC